MRFESKVAEVDEKAMAVLNRTNSLKRRWRRQCFSATEQQCNEKTAATAVNLYKVWNALHLKKICCHARMIFQIQFNLKHDVIKHDNKQITFLKISLKNWLKIS